MSEPFENEIDTQGPVVVLDCDLKMDRWYHGKLTDDMLDVQGEYKAAVLKAMKLGVEYTRVEVTRPGYRAGDKAVKRHYWVLESQLGRPTSDDDLEVEFQGHTRTMKPQEIIQMIKGKKK